MPSKDSFIYKILRLFESLLTTFIYFIFVVIMYVYLPESINWVLGMFLAFFIPLLITGAIMYVFHLLVMRNFK